jgi:hypothetical protein
VAGMERNRISRVRIEKLTERAGLKPSAE